MRTALFVAVIVVSSCADAVPIGLRTAMVSPAVVSPNTLPQIAENAAQAATVAAARPPFMQPSHLCAVSNRSADMPE